MSDRPSLPYWHVDAFSAAPFGGNQAAVVIVEEWPSDATMLAIAAENLFAETAFLLEDPGAEADYQLRWFTPALEVALCGHATLASGHAILSRDQERGLITFRTRKAGVLEVRREGADYALGLPVIETAAGIAHDLASGLRADPLESTGNDNGYGIFRFADEAAVRALDPDMAELARHGDYMFICTAPGDRTDIVSRVFAPGAGVPEDSVTGSAHAALAPFWAGRLGRDSFTAHQASQRGGDLSCRLEGDRAWLGGPCVTVVEGRFYLSA